MLDSAGFRFSRGDWHSFEPMIAAVVDAALSPNAETIVATRVVRSIAHVRVLA